MLYSFLSSRTVLLHNLAILSGLTVAAESSTALSITKRQDTHHNVR